jgi:ATP-dependent RNA helicase SUPV3L1/SUV3
MAERTREVEEKLSDALHERLTQRFVDRRTSVLMRDLVGKGGADYPVVVDEQGEVTVGTHPIGRMEGFAFEVDPTARHSDRKMLLAAAERRLGGEYEKRGAALAADSDDHFSLRTEAGQPVALLWRGHDVARLGPGKNLLSPRVALDRRLERLSVRGRETVIERLDLWLRGQVERVLGSLRAAGQAARDPGAPPGVRSTLAMLVDEGGIVARDSVAKPLAGLDRDQRRLVTRLGIRIGALDLFMPEILKPEARRWRTALRAAASGEPMPELPPEASVVLPAPSDDSRALLSRLGYRSLGPQMLRVDLVERLAKHAHEARAGKRSEAVDEALATSLALRPEAVARLMRDLGFRPAPQTSGDTSGWVWRGRSRKPRQERQPSSPAFAALAGLRRG